MSDHLSKFHPAPTPTRAVYGFAVFLVFKTLFIIYVFWAFTPKSFLEETLRLTYLPDKYFALYVPILILVAVAFFAFLIYPSMNLAMTLNINDVRTIKDSYTIKRCHCGNKIELNGWENPIFCPTHLNNTEYDEEKDDCNQISNYCDCTDKDNCLLNDSTCDYLSALKKRKKVPAVSDLDISLVCKELYGK